MGGSGLRANPNSGEKLGVNNLGMSGSNSQTSSGSISYRGKHLKLLASLYGHTEPITCLASSDAFNLIVSGSRDRTCILWDLNQLCYLTQLSGHCAPVSAVCINGVTGDIATCAGNQLHLWNCNGQPIASVNIEMEANKQVLCISMSSVRYFSFLFQFHYYF